MDATATQSRFNRFGPPLTFFLFTLAITLIMPSISFLLAILMPLYVCPFRRSMGLWVSLTLPLIPCAQMLYAQVDAGLVIGSLCFSYFSLLAANFVRQRNLPSSAAALWHVLAILASLMLLCGRIAFLVGDNLFQGVARSAVEAFNRLPNANSLLATMVQTRFLTLPSQLEETAFSFLGSRVFLLPSLRAEMLNDLRFQISVILQQELPGTLVKVSLVIGLFTALKTLRSDFLFSSHTGFLQSENPAKTKIARYMDSSFRMFSLPANYQCSLLVLGLTSMLFTYTGRGGVFPILSALMNATVFNSYALAGAAFFVLSFSLKFSNHNFLAGVVVAVLYICFPTLLFFIGLFHHIFHLGPSNITDREDEED